jgi:peptide/nickel transport system substrate-binding protein
VTKSKQSEFELSRRSMLVAAGAAAGSAFLGGSLLTRKAFASEGRGGTLVWATPADADALDPHAMSGWIGRSVTGQIFEGLLMFDLTDPNARYAKLQPALAESYEVTDDGKVWTFKLRQGVKFHDGTPFDAEAVKYNVDRIVDKEAPQYFKKTAAYMSSINLWLEKFEIVDPHTVRFTLNKPNYEWFAGTIQEYGTFFIMSPASIKKYGNDSVALHPTGTGPFRFVEREAGVKIVMKRNDDYWGKKAKLDQLVVVKIADPSARVNALLAGEVHMLNVPQWEQIDNLKQNKDLILTTNVNVPSLWYMHINMRHKILNDKRVRQALLYGFNRKGMAERLMRNTVTPAYGMLSAGTFAYDPNFTMYEYNPDKAKALLAEAGYAKGFEVNMDTFIYGLGELYEQWFQRDMAAIGIKVNLNKFEWISYIGRWSKGMDENTGLNTMGWGQSVPSFTSVVSRCTATPSNGLNSGWYCNEEVDKLFDKAVAIGDKEEAAKVYQHANKLIMEDAAFIPCFNDSQPVFLNKSVKGFVNPPENWFDFSNAWVES